MIIKIQIKIKIQEKRGYYKNNTTFLLYKVKFHLEIDLYAYVYAGQNWVLMIRRHTQKNQK